MMASTLARKYPGTYLLILQMLARGVSLTEIAKITRVSRKTVKTIFERNPDNIEKLKARNREGGANA